MPTAPRTLVAIVSCFASLALSAAQGLSAFRSARASDGQLLASYRGAAYGDVFGFGFWPTLGVAAILQAVVLLLAWRLLSQSSRRVVVPLLIAAFVTASLLEYSSFEREHSLWQKQ